VLLKHARDFSQSAQELGGTLSGDIHVGAFLTLAVRFMPPLLARFARLEPRIAISLQEGDQEELMAMLASGRIELALGYNYALTDEVEADPLAELPPHVVVSATHPLAGRGCVSLTDLADEPFILLDLPHSRDCLFGLFRAVGVEPRIVFRTRSQELIRGLVAHGHGYGIQNAIPATTTAYDGGEIAVLAIAEALPPTRVMCLRLKRHAMRPGGDRLRGVSARRLRAGRAVRARVNNRAPDRSGAAALGRRERGGCSPPPPVPTPPAP